MRAEARIRHPGVLSAAAALLLVVGACSGGGDSVVSGGPTPDGPGSATSTVAETGARANGAGASAAPTQGSGSVGAGTGGSDGTGSGGSVSGGGSRPYAGEVGVTDNTVTIGFIFARSGPYQALLRNWEPAISAAFADVNEKGGVHGRTVVPIFGDDGYNNASLALQSAQAMKDKVFGISTGVANAFAYIYNFAEENRIPYVYLNGERTAGLKLRYGFPSLTFLDTQAEMLPDFMIAKFHARTRRIGIIYQDTVALKPAVDSFKRVAANRGLNVVVSQPVSETPSTCVNEVSNAQGAEAEVVWLFGGPVMASCVLRDADNIGYHPTWTGTSNTFNFQVTNTAAGCKTEGMVTMGAWNTLESKAGQGYQAAMREHYPNNVDAPDDDLAYGAWGWARVWIEALRRAGPNPTRESLVRGMETMRGWNGGQFSPLTFGPRNRIGGTQVLTVKVVDCTWVTIDPRWRDHF